MCSPRTCTPRSRSSARSSGRPVSTRAGSPWNKRPSAPFRGGSAFPSQTRNRGKVSGMRRYGLYDATRGLTLALAAGLAGLLLYLASRVGQQTTARFWAELGLVSAEGLVLALAPVL